MEYKNNLEALLVELDSRGGSDIHFNIDEAPAIRVDGSGLAVLLEKSQ